jgi:hypothetical protein
MPIWLIIVIAVLVILAVGGVIARRQQLKRSRPAFERNLSKADRDLAAAAALDRGWDREVMETVARRVAAERHGAEPEQLTLVEVIDKPGTDDDQAVFEADGRRIVIGRRHGEWK